MDISAALAADLAALSRVLDDPDIDLEAELIALGADLRTAVGSYLGMTMSIVLDGHEISFTVRETVDGLDHTAGATSNVMTSLLIPLPSRADALAGNTLVLYAGTPGAFVNLAADLSFALGVELSALQLDAHVDGGHSVTSTTPDVGMDGLDELSVVSQALGILLGRGHTPESARRELRGRAEQDSGNLGAAAAAVVAEVNRNR